MGRLRSYCSRACSDLVQKNFPKRLVAETFWARVDCTGDCWPWLGARDPDGYGNLRAGNVNYRAHRAAYELTAGPIPSGMEIMHACDNPPCCNPRHLSPGSHQQNMAHQWSKRKVLPRMGRSAADRMQGAVG